MTTMKRRLRADGAALLVMAIQVWGSGIVIANEMLPPWPKDAPGPFMQKKLGKPGAVSPR